MAMVPAALIGSYLAEKHRGSIGWKLFVSIIMNTILYLFGVAWMMYRLNLSFKSAFLTGCAPFLLADAVKIIAAAKIGMTIQDDADRILAKGF